MANDETNRGHKDSEQPHRIPQPHLAPGRTQRWLHLRLQLGQWKRGLQSGGLHNVSGVLLLCGRFVLSSSDILHRMLQCLVDL